MPVKFVDKVGTLNERMPEDNIDPANAVVARYLDPFRSEPGTIMPAFGFGANNPTSRPSNWETDGYPYRVVAAFMMAGMQIIITSLRDATQPEFEYGVIYYVDADGVLQLIPFSQTAYVIPSRILVDPNVYTSGKPDEPNYREFYNAYLWGYNTNLNLRKPNRLMLCKKYHNGLPEPDNYELIWSVWPACLTEIPVSYTLDVRYAGPNWPSGPAIGLYRYFIILEDVSGNWIHVYNSVHFVRGFESTSGAGVVIEMTIDNAESRAYKSMYVYRDKYTAGEESEFDIDVSFAEARLVGIGIFGQYSENMAWVADKYVNQSDLTDLIPFGRQELRAWQENVNRAFDTIGWHNNALWISLDNEVFFSQYTLDAPYGTRPLNFPTFNRWRFEGIGKIIDILSQNHKLVVMGTEGISILSGTYIDNFFEEKSVLPE